MADQQVKESFVPISTVDAFTSSPFRGNPAAVCVTDTPLEEDQLRLIAAEMNLSGNQFMNQYPMIQYLLL
jgi:PhzF family phenazine biosynthesis protein